MIPQSEAELTADEVGIRALATETLGAMFANIAIDKGSGLITVMISSVRSDLAGKFPSTWKAWLGRAEDKALQVRLMILEAFKDIIVTHTDLRKDVYGAPYRI